MDQVLLDHTTSREELWKTFESKGVELSAFAKTPEEVWKEYRNRDLTTIWSDRFQAFVQTRYTIELWVQTPEGFICETGRLWDNKSEPDMNTVAGMLSGTQKRYETPGVTVSRESTAELKLKKDRRIPLSELTIINDRSDAPEGVLRTSRIHPRLKSLRYVTRYLWKTERIFRRTTIRDTGVTSLLGRFAEIPQQALDNYAKARAAYEEAMLNDEALQAIDGFKRLILIAEQKQKSFQAS